MQPKLLNGASKKLANQAIEILQKNKETISNIFVVFKKQIFEEKFEWFLNITRNAYSPSHNDGKPTNEIQV